MLIQRGPVLPVLQEHQAVRVLDVAVDRVEQAAGLGAGPVDVLEGHGHGVVERLRPDRDTPGHEDHVGDGRRLWTRSPERGTLERVSSMDQRDDVILRVASRVRRGLERDPLRGLLTFSHESFVAAIDDSLADLTAAGIPLSLVFADVDHFKLVNDEYGHRVGDGVLAAVGMTLRDLVRPLDLVLAGGGDAFLLVLLGAGSDVAVARAHTARERLAGLELAGAPNGLTASFGVVTHDGRETAVGLLDRGFEAEFRAKALGRDRVEAAGP